METVAEETQNEGTEKAASENSSTVQVPTTAPELSADLQQKAAKTPPATRSTAKTPAATLPTAIATTAKIPAATPSTGKTAVSTAKTPTSTPSTAKTPSVTPSTAKTPTATPSTAKTPTATPSTAKIPTAKTPTAKTPTATPTSAKTPTATPSTGITPEDTLPAAQIPLPELPKKTKRDDRNRREDDYVKQFMRALNGAPTLEEKMQIASHRYSHMVEDNKKMQFYIKQSEKRYTMLLKQKEQLQMEFNKTVLVKSKLENLCRELQKQNKTIKEESLLKIREEEERRKETQAKFQNTLTDITALLEQNNEKNAKLRDDNISMTEKFKNVVTQYQLREQQVDKMAKQMSLEQQLADAKFMKAKLEHQAERERLLAEMEGLRVSVQQYRAKMLELQGTESGLRSQLAVYTDKYDEFQNALVKSNQVFGGFKEEMEKMSKKIKKLEKESLSWKKRWELSQTALLDMCGERQASEARAAAVNRQLHNMQSLCRTLQAERTVLLSSLKEHNIERPPLPAPVPAPPPPPPPAQPAQPAQPANNAKVDAMAANCAQLRQSLAHLQSQLNVLTYKQQQPATPEEPPKPEKTKKSKSKKSKKQEALKESESAKESATESASEDKAAGGTQKDAPNVNIEDKTGENVKKETPGDKVEAVIDEIETMAEKAEKIAIGDDAVDDKTLETLIQAINNANINLCDLEVIGDDKIDIDDILDVDSLSKEDEITKSTDTASNDVSEIETSNKDSSNEDSPKNGPKIDLDEVSNGLIDEAKIDELSEEITDNPNIVEITDEIASRPKIIELPDDYEAPKTLSEASIGVPEEKLKYLDSDLKNKVDTESMAQERNA